MSPKRTKTIGGRIVKEFYWAGEYPVYVDHRFTPGSFEEVCERLERDAIAEEEARRAIEGSPTDRMITDVQTPEAAPLNRAGRRDRRR